MRSCLPDYFRWVECSAAAFSISGNSLLLFFIICRTPQDLKLYSRVLLSNCISDMVFTTIAFFTEMHVSLRHGYCTYIINGFFKGAGLLLVYVQVLLYLTAMYTAIYVVTIPFVYRYFVVCREYVMTNRTFGLFVAFEVSLSIAAVGFFGIVCWPHTVEALPIYHRAAENETCTDVGDLPFYRLVDAYSFWTGVVGLSLLNVMILVVLHYSVILFCSYRIWRRIRHASMTPTVAALSTQLNIILSFQATTPFLICVVPVVYAITAVLSSASSSLAISIMEDVTILLSLIPVFNPIYTILFVKAYRNAFLNVISHILPIKRLGVVEPLGVEPLSTTAGFDLSVAPSLF